MGVANHESKFVIGFAVLTFAILFIFGMGKYLGGTITHPYPATLLGNDHFIFWAMAQGAYDQGHYRSIPPYLNFGYADTLTHFSPASAILPAVFAYATNIPVRDSQEVLFLLLFISLPIPFLLLYRRMGTAAFLFTLALLPLLFRRNFIYAVGRSQYQFIPGVFFFFLLLLVLSIPNLRRPFVLSLLFSAMVLSHPPQAFFFGVFLLALACGALAYRSLSRMQWHALLLFTGKTALLSLLFINLYLVVFSFGSLPAIGGNPADYGLRFKTPAEFYPGVAVSFTNFPIPYLALILIGIAVLPFTRIPHRGILLFFLILANVNYFAFLPTFELRAFQYRFLWPILLAPLFGLGAAKLLSFVFRKKPETPFSFAVLGALILVLIPAIILSARGTFDHPVMNQFQYDGFQWVKQHTAPSADVLFLYGDGYDQSAIALRRTHARLYVHDMVRMLRQNFTDTNFTPIYDRSGIEVNVAWDGFGTRPLEGVLQRLQQNRSMCDFDYYVADTYSWIRAGARLMYFNSGFVAQQVERNALTVVYQNNQTVVFQNLKRGVSCG